METNESGGWPLILVVDDQPEVREFVRQALEEEGYAVVTAADGREALGTPAAPGNGHQPRPALVVLDIGLPGGAGGTVAAALRRAHGPGLPVLVITGDGQAPQKAAGAGAFDYLRKPFGVEDLLARVRAGLGGAAPGPHA